MRFHLFLLLGPVLVSASTISRRTDPPPGYSKEPPRTPSPIQIAFNCETKKLKDMCTGAGAGCAENGAHRDIIWSKKPEDKMRVECEIHCDCKRMCFHNAKP
jgi:hypothetical protein